MFKWLEHESKLVVIAVAMFGLAATCGAIGAVAYAVALASVR